MTITRIHPHRLSDPNRAETGGTTKIPTMALWAVTMLSGILRDGIRESGSHHVAWIPLEDSFMVRLAWSDAGDMVLTVREELAERDLSAYYGIVGYADQIKCRLVVLDENGEE